jgi:hypothetical protein
MEFTKVLNRLGESAIIREDEPDDIGAAFQKFAVVTKELASLKKNLVILNFVISLTKQSYKFCNLKIEILEAFIYDI